MKHERTVSSGTSTPISTSPSEVLPVTSLPSGGMMMKSGRHMMALSAEGLSTTVSMA